MLFTPIDCNEKKYHCFLTTEFIQAQFVKYCRPIYEYFKSYMLAVKLTKSIKLSC